MKKISVIVTMAMILSLFFCASIEVFAKEEEQVILLSSEKTEEGFEHGATLNGVEIPKYEYVWHIDPTKPEPYYTGNAPGGNDSVYIAHDIYYYPLLDENKFKKVSYDGEQEWAYFYEAEGLESYIFSTLPVFKSGFPSQMMHSSDEAYKNAVLHITKAGNYTLKGDWHGQIRIDLGEESFDDPTKKVILTLDGVNIECTVASGIVFAEIFECDNEWEYKSAHIYSVDTSNAGAVIRIADGSENKISGSNIFRLLKPKYKEENSDDTYPAQKKLLKVDGALYSYRSMNIEGDSGVLNITSSFEGINSELHLTVNGGNVNINSQDDGINVNEDGVSVLTVNGGNLHICAGLGDEGDGIDSNGYLVINGGVVISAANPAADSGMDSDRGSFVNGGTVVSLGSTMDWAKADNTTTSQAILNLRFAEQQNADEAIIVTDKKENIIFAYDAEKDEAMGKNSRTYSGAVISSPDIKIGETVRIYVGGDVTGDEKNGVYDASAAKKFEGATQQCYSGNVIGGGRPEMQNWQDVKGERPDMPFEEEGQIKPDMPDGEQFGDNRSEMPKGNTFADNYNDFSSVATCGYENEFALNETVNDFSGVVNLKHNPEKKDGKYVCTECSSIVSVEEYTQGTKVNFDWLIYVLVFLGGAVSASLVFTIVLLIKNRRG